MKKLTHRFLIIISVLLVMMPIVAQETPIDPDGELDETYTLGNVTINYPTGMFVAGNPNAVTFGFDDRGEERISFSTPAQLARDGFVMDDIDTIARSWFEALAPIFLDERTFEEVGMLTILAGHPAVTFDLIPTNEDYPKRAVAYVFDVDGTIFGALLISEEFSFPLDVQHALMIRMMESITIDGEPIYEPLVRTAPEDRVTLGQPVSTENLTYLLPEEWVFAEDEVYFGTSESAIAVARDDADTLDAGELGGGIFVTPRLIEGRQLLTTSYYAYNFADDYEVDVYIYEGLGTEAYYIALPEGNSIMPSGVSVVIWEISEAYVGMMIVATDDFDAQETAILSIIESVALVEEDAG
jgi:hypothetical protein